MCKQVIAKTTEISHEEWLKLRLKGIGGSECAAAVGMSRWKTPLEVFMEKTGRKAQVTETEKMYWGRTLEPIIRAEFTRRTSLKTQVVPYMMNHREYPYMLANIDGIVIEKDGTKCLLELKTAGTAAEKEWTEESIPVEYYLQVQHYLFVTGLPKAYVAVLIGGNKFQWQILERDEETIQTLVALESYFWSEYVLKDVPPPVDANSGEALAMLYPTAEKDKTIVLPLDADEMIAQWLEIKKAEEEIKTAKATCENQLKALLKDAESGTTANGYTVRWTAYTQSRLDTMKLKAEQPDIAAKYTTQSNARKFSIVEPKDKK